MLVTGPVVTGETPTVGVAPYVDLTTPPLPTLTDMADATGQADVVLAFVLAGDDGACAPTWGGTTPLTDPAVGPRIAALQARGGTMTVSSGGAIGDYLEAACPDAPSLARAYGAALDLVGTDHLDVDVETDRGREVSVRRIASLALLQRERGTRVTLTVQIDGVGEGLSADAQELVRQATTAGVAARVNLMVMNYAYDGGTWAAAMTGAARTAVRQLEGVWPGSEPAEVRRRTG